MEPIGQRSLAATAREAIIDAIVKDRFDGGRIPPETELAEILGVSRTTVRAALQSLQDAGVIVRTRGRGTVVRAHAKPSALALQRLVSFPTMLEESGLRATMETDWRLTLDIPEDVRETLSISNDAECYEWNVLFRADGRPAIAIRHLFPSDYVAKELPDDLDLPDWFAFSELYGRVPIDHAAVDIRAVNADAETAMHLDVTEGSAVLVLLETHYSVQDRPLAFSRIAVNDSIVGFRVLRTHS